MERYSCPAGLVHRGPRAEPICRKEANGMMVQWKMPVTNSRRSAYNESLPKPWFFQNPPRGVARYSGVVKRPWAVFRRAPDGGRDEVASGPAGLGCGACTTVS